jgi:hypothetical protein
VQWCEHTATVETRALAEAQLLSVLLSVSSEHRCSNNGTSLLENCYKLTGATTRCLLIQQGRVTIAAWLWAL